MEYSLRQTEENFTKAQSTIVQLQEAKENLENKNHSLEAKLFELIEKEQSAEERARYWITHLEWKIHIDIEYKDNISLRELLSHKSVCLCVEVCLLFCPLPCLDVPPVMLENFQIKSNVSH